MIVAIRHVFSIHKCLPGPSGDVENSGQRQKFSKSSEGSREKVSLEMLNKQSSHGQGKIS